jgi:hypothetical protein
MALLGPSGPTANDSNWARYRLSAFEAIADIEIDFLGGRLLSVVMGFVPRRWAS